MRQLGDLLNQVDRADDQPHLGVLIFLAAVVGHPHEAVEAELLLVLVGNEQVIGAPGDAAGEVSDLDRRLAVDLALDVPKELLRLVVRESRVEHIELVGAGQELQLDGGRVDERVGPGELQWVDALLERHRAGLAHERQVLAVVDRQLDAIPLGDCREIDVAGDHGGGSRNWPDGDGEQQHVKGESHGDRRKTDGFRCFCQMTGPSKRARQDVPQKYCPRLDDRQRLGVPESVDRGAKEGQIQPRHRRFHHTQVVEVQPATCSFFDGERRLPGLPGNRAGPRKSTSGCLL